MGAEGAAKGGAMNALEMVRLQIDTPLLPAQSARGPQRVSEKRQCAEFLKRIEPLLRRTARKHQQGERLTRELWLVTCNARAEDLQRSRAWLERTDLWPIERWWSRCDWNRDGSVDIGEMINTVQVGQRRGALRGEREGDRRGGE